MHSYSVYIYFPNQENPYHTWIRANNEKQLADAIALWYRGISGYQIKYCTCMED